MSAGALEKVDDVGDVGGGEASRGIADGILTTSFQKNACRVVTADLHVDQRAFRTIGIVQADGECGVSEGRISLRVGQSGQTDVIVAARRESHAGTAIVEFRERRAGPDSNLVGSENRSRAGIRL